MRCFIAIDLSEEVRRELSDVQKELRDKADIRRGDVTWVKPEQMHLTVKFFGEVRDEKVAEICRVLSAAAAKHRCFDMEVAGVGFFGANARVLWVGVGENCMELFALQNDIEESLAKNGWPKETRAFAGHLTLCRIKNFAAGKKLMPAAKKYDTLKFGSVFVDSVCMYQSTLTPEGPIYTVLSRSSLQ